MRGRVRETAVENVRELLKHFSKHLQELQGVIRTHFQGESQDEMSLHLQELQELREAILKHLKEPVETQDQPHIQKRIYVKDAQAEIHLHLLDTIRMLDRVIGGLLGHPDSPYVQDYRTYSKVLFPSGLEATRPGKDIVLILNQGQIDVLQKDKARRIEIPRALKNPEKGVAQVAGRKLAQQLFQVRGKVLSLLALRDSGWSVNITANDAAQHVLKFYDPEGSPLSQLSILKKPKPKSDHEAEPPNANSWWRALCPCMR